MKRVALGSIMHETNTFSPIATPFEAFHEGMPDILDGQRVLDAMRGTKTGIGGSMDVGAEQEWEMIGTVSAHATPSANVRADAHERLKGRLIEELRAAGKLEDVVGRVGKGEGLGHCRSVSAGGKLQIRPAPRNFRAHRLAGIVIGEDRIGPAKFFVQ